MVYTNTTPIKLDELIKPNQPDPANQPIIISFYHLTSKAR